LLQPERATLRDGTEVLLRLVTADDKALLRDGFERLSPESRYARFFSPKSRLTDEELEYLCNVDGYNHFAIGAVRVSDGKGLGIARFIRLADPEVAEAAIAVADEAQGQGLGRLLFERLVEAGVERDVKRFRCEVLGSNTSMKQLVDGVAPEHKTEVGSGVMSIDFDLPQAEARESEMYRFFRGTAAAK
jgi:ribosomal protein S18 acetylase RimI-like enzyme